MQRAKDLRVSNEKQEEKLLVERTSNAPEEVGVFLVNHRGMVLDAGPATPGTRVSVEERKDEDFESQLWIMREDGAIEHFRTGLVLTIPGGNASPVGTKMTLNHADPNSNGQTWRFDGEIGGILCESRREVALDVEGVGLKGAYAIVWYRQQAANAMSQRWTFRSPKAPTASGSPPTPFPFCQPRAPSPTIPVLSPPAPNIPVLSPPPPPPLASDTSSVSSPPPPSAPSALPLPSAPPIPSVPPLDPSSLPSPPPSDPSPLPPYPSTDLPLPLPPPPSSPPPPLSADPSAIPPPLPVKPSELAPSLPSLPSLSSLPLPPPLTDTPTPGEDTPLPLPPPSEPAPSTVQKASSPSVSSPALPPSLSQPQAPSSNAAPPALPSAPSGNSLTSPSPNPGPNSNANDYSPFNLVSSPSPVPPNLLSPPTTSSLPLSTSPSIAPVSQYSPAPASQYSPYSPSPYAQSGVSSVPPQLLSPPLTTSQYQPPMNSSYYSPSSAPYLSYPPPQSSPSYPPQGYLPTSSTIYPTPPGFPPSPTPATPYSPYNSSVSTPYPPNQYSPATSTSSYPASTSPPYASTSRYPAYATTYSSTYSPAPPTTTSTPLPPGYSPNPAYSSLFSSSYSPPITSSAASLSFSQRTSPYQLPATSQASLPVGATTTPPAGTFFIGSKLNNLVLDVDRSSGYVVTWPRKQENFANQLWRMDSVGFITSVETGMALEVEGDRAGYRIRVAYKKPMDHGTVANQRWTYNATTMEFVNYQGLCMDIDKSNINAGTPIIAWTPFQNAANQQFYFIPYSN